MRILLLICLLTLSVAPAAAQDADEDGKTYLENLIEGALSGGARVVTVTGFQGALSSNATLTKMTIADEQGIWLTLEDASLIWSRSALLRGRLEVDELIAGSIDLARLPEGEARVTPEDAEAKPFALPDLPVSVSIDTLRADKVRLGPGVIGEEATLSVESSLELAGGAAEAVLDIRRTDRNDKVTLDAAFSNETRVLRIDLDFDEAEGGLVSKLLRIPGQPELRLQVQGEAPLTDYQARVALSSEGTQRLTGDIQIAAVGEDESTGYRFSSTLDGDLRPLFTPDLHPFFGERAGLSVAGQTTPTGGLVLDTLNLTSGAMEVEGSLALAPDGWPERLSLDGRIGDRSENGRPLRLPTAEPVTHIESATFKARYDETMGEAWHATLAVAGLDRDGLTVDNARLYGTGTITRGMSDGLTADVSFETENVAHNDAALARTIGSAPRGRARFNWKPGAPVVLDRLDLTSGDMSLTANGEVDGLADGFPVSGRATVRSEDLSRFAPLADRDIAGAANATIQGDGTLLGGAFDIEVTASTTDLRTDTPRLDPLLAGRSTLELAARRDETGTMLDNLRLRNDAISADISGELNAESGELTLAADLAELSLAEPRLTGPARLESRIGWTANGKLTLSQLRLEAVDAVLEADGTLATDDPNLPAEGRLSLVAQDLSRLSELAGRRLAGEIDLDIEGSGTIRGQSVDATIALAGSRIRTGLAELDRIIAGDLSLDAALAYDGGAPFIDRLDLKTPRLSAKASSPAPGEPVTVAARLSDLGLVSPELSGPARLDGTLSFPDDSGDTVNLNLRLDGPGGTSARVAGPVSGYGQSLSLSVTGNAPLALANGFISPRSVAGPARFDLRLDGPPRLSSLSGTVGVTNARVALPRLKSAISGLTGTATFASGRMQTDLRGNAGSGGTFRLLGPVTLSPPFPAALEIRLARLGLVDPALYETRVDGTVTVTGPLTGGARIGGALTLDRTELRVPSGGGGAPGDIPNITHVGEPAAVNLTRRRAGLVSTGKQAPGAAFPLDLTINAPNRIFVRGRGLDAELGGRLHLGGTTANVNASGFFNLIRGRIDVLTKRLDLTEGLINLRGALDPYLRFVARTETDELTVNVILEGLASAPNISFTSSPELPQEEILAQLLFGRSFSNMSAFQAAQLAGAVATLSGKRSGGLTGKLRDTLGLSDFDVTSTEEGATEFSAGAYISDNIYSEISTDTEGRNEINLNLDLTPSITVKGKANNEGNTGVGIFFERDY